MDRRKTVVETSRTGELRVHRERSLFVYISESLTGSDQSQAIRVRVCHIELRSHRELPAPVDVTPFATGLHGSESIFEHPCIVELRLHDHFSRVIDETKLPVQPHWKISRRCS